MEIVWILLLTCLILLIAQQITLMSYRRRYIRACSANENVNRALAISKNKLIDSERERKFLDNQITILMSEENNPNIDFLKCSIVAERRSLIEMETDGR